MLYIFKIPLACSVMRFILEQYLQVHFLDTQYILSRFTNQYNCIRFQTQPDFPNPPSTPPCICHCSEPEVNMSDRSNKRECFKRAAVFTLLRKTTCFYLALYDKMRRKLLQVALSRKIPSMFMVCERYIRWIYGMKIQWPGSTADSQTRPNGKFLQSSCAFGIKLQYFH